MNLSRVRGIKDLLEKDTRSVEKVVKTFKVLSSRAAYSLITLPTLEESSLYVKSLGFYSDIVSKEMFEIKGQSYVLRPEGTAGAIRSYLMNCSQGEKKQWSYTGSMFRHEKPQKGRFREFIQFGVESISSSFSGQSDAECIILAFDILKTLKVPSELQINTLGDEHGRKEYNKALGEYFQGKSLSKNSKIRAEGGKFLRILDSKEAEDQETIKNAPKIDQFLSDSDKQYFEVVKRTLTEFEVPFTHNFCMVRGLDYYTNVCFEFVNDGQAILGGGRYDNLAGFVERDKGIGGIGWAAGVNRIAEKIPEIDEDKVIGIVPVGVENTGICMKISRAIRNKTEFVVKMKTEASSMKQHMNYLKGLNPFVILFIGEEEVVEGKVKIKVCESGQHCFVSISEILEDPNRLFAQFFK